MNVLLFNVDDDNDNDDIDYSFLAFEVFLRKNLLLHIHGTKYVNGKNLLLNNVVKRRPN